MADQKAVFAMPVADVSREETKARRFFRISICRRYLYLPSIPRTLDLAFFVSTTTTTTTTTTDTTDYFTPAAHACAGVKIDYVTAEGLFTKPI